MVQGAHLPAAIGLLHRQQGLETPDVADADPVADDEAHGQTGRVDGDADALLEPLDEEAAHAAVDAGADALEAGQEPGEEEEEGFGDRVEGCAVDVGAAGQDLLDPGEGFGELVAAAVLVEEAQDVAADDGVDAVLEVGEKGLFCPTMGEEDVSFLSAWTGRILFAWTILIPA